jgi:tetratricopeptide (TPR) repeat protein
LGRTTEFDAFLKSLPGTTAFMTLRLQGDVKRAFELVGLEDLSLETVSKWIENREFDKWLAGDLAGDLADEETVKLKELAIVNIGDLFFQIGLNSQGKLIDDYLIQKTKELEGAHGVSAWAPLLRQWLLSNERKKAIHQWTEFLVRESRRTKPRSSTNAIRDQLTATNPFSDFFPEFPTAAEKIFETLLELAIQSEMESANSNNEEVTSRAISKAMEQLEDLHLGRLPSGWISNRMLMDLRQDILSKAKRKWESTTSLAFELAELFDSLGDTQMAIETLELIPIDKLIPIGKAVAQAKARYLAKQGELDAACSLLGNEFQRNATDLGLLLDCTDNLYKAGRYSEMERILIQGLSSVSNERLDISDRSLFLLPVRREVQLIVEQLWWRNYDFDPVRLDAVRCLTLQFGEAANTDLSQASAAAKFSRIDTIERAKFYWPNERNDFVRLQISYTRAFRSFILEAIANNNRELADTLYRTVHRCAPQEIEMPIIVIPFAEKAFGKDFADGWFNLYYQPMMNHLKEFPNDPLIGNNTAWFAAKCNRNLETAWSLASKVVASDPTSTYLDTLAEIEYRLGRVERAIELSELCRGLEPRDKQHREQLKRFREGRP